MDTLPITQQSLTAFLDKAASANPTPGGGSVAALAGALAAAMASMAGALTLSSAKHADVHARMAELRTETEALRADLMRLAQEDIDAFAALSAAYALPRATEADKATRSAAIRAACRAALVPPLETIRRAARLAGLLPEIARIGNVNLISDTGVAAHLCRAAAAAARLNVLINANALSGEADPILAEADAGVAATDAAVETALALVAEALAPRR